MTGIRAPHILAALILTIALSLPASAQRVSRFTPSHGVFFKQVLKEKGPVSAVLATTDRLVRDTRIGLASSHYLKPDGLVHEDFSGPLPFGFDYPSFKLDSLSCLRGQGRFIGYETDFIEYLLGNNFSREAVYYVHGGGFVPSDTLDYYKGLSLYTAGALKQAASSFGKVSRASIYYEPSVFLGAVCDVYDARYDSALASLRSYAGPKRELKSYEAAAISLLQDDAQAYRSFARDFTYNNYSLSEGEKMFDKIYRERFEQKRKSPWLAAGLSAVVPGLGKFYSGQYGEGAASLMLVGALGGFAAESWVKNGAGDWRTIAFTAIASLLHISNIYGSYISVGLYDSYLKDAQNQTIVFYIHLPVRSVFR